MTKEEIERISRQAIDTAIFDVIADVADSLDVEAYAVGGYVRDFFLYRSCKDIDIVSVGKGIDLALEVAKLLGDRKVNVYKNFGTAQIVYDDYNIGVLGARKESYRSDSCKPVVEEDNLDDDQKRSYFTNNALSIGS